MRLFSGLQGVRITRRLLIMGAAFTLPIAPMLILLTQGVNVVIDTAELELDGNAYQRPLERLLQGISERQLLLTGADRSSTQEADATIDRSFDELAAVDQRIGAHLQFTTDGLAQRNRDHVRVETVRAEWDTLKAGVPAGDVATKHRHLLDDVRTMITHAGDTSFLILDPDLDSYYTMDATLLALPQTQDRITSILAYVKQRGSKKVLTHDEQIQLAAYASTLEESDIARIAGDVDTALNEDKNFYGVNGTLQSALKPGVDQYLDSARKLVATLRTASTAPTSVTATPPPSCKAPVKPRRRRAAKWLEQCFPQPTPVAVDLAPVLAAGIAAHRESFAAWQPSVDTLDALLNTRRDAYTSTRAWTLALSALAWLAAIGVAFAVSRSITGPLTRITSELGAGARHVTSTAGAVAESAQEMARGANNQGSSLEQASSSMEQMAAMTRANADQASKAATLMEEARASVDGSHVALDQMMQSMNGIRDSSRQISRIIKTVDEIAFQTNLLALNAAVEAARAGSAGAGFAVVADEVRSLAQRSADAARSTAELIEDAIVKTREGNDNVDQVAASVRALVERVTDVKAIVDQVSDASHQQAQGIGQVTAAISEIERVTHATASTAEQSASASELLSAHADATLLAVAKLHTMIAGAQRPSKPAPGKPAAAKPRAAKTRKISAGRAA